MWTAILFGISLTMNVHVVAVLVRRWVRRRDYCYGLDRKHVFHKDEVWGVDGSCVRFVRCFHCGLEYINVSTTSGLRFRDLPVIELPEDDEGMTRREKAIKRLRSLPKFSGSLIAATGFRKDRR